jgi:hypothetical protein
MAMQLYEVVRWGNDDSDTDDAGPNGEDTCFLVRAGSPAEAATLADEVLSETSENQERCWADVVHHLGIAAGANSEAAVLRGPYLEHAFNDGWATWHRQSRSGPWVEWHDSEEDD